MPLRISLQAEPKPSPEDCRTVAAILARTGLDLNVVAPGEGDVVVLWGTVSENPDRPLVRLPRTGRQNWRDQVEDALRAWDRNPEKPFAEDKDSLDFDLLAAFGAILSGLPERDASEDEHGRAAPEDNLLAEGNRLIGAPLDTLARDFGRVLLEAAGREDRRSSPGWYLSLSLDIDSAGMFRGRALFRNLREIARQSPRKFPRAALQAVFSPLGPEYADPHLRLRRLAETLEGMNAPATFFLQTHRRHRIDSYWLHESRELLRQMRWIAQNRHHEIGLHSSYATRESSRDFFAAQWRNLVRFIGPGIRHVHRAHFLRTPGGVDYPWPVRRGDLVDSSLMFSHRTGFRRGTAWPFRVQDRIVELCPAVMDVGLRKHQGRTVEESFQDCCRLFDTVGKNGGAAVLLWHPNNMEDYLWPGWKELFLDLIQEAKQRGAKISGVYDTATALQANADRLEGELRAAVQ